MGIGLFALFCFLAPFAAWAGQALDSATNDAASAFNEFYKTAREKRLNPKEARELYKKTVTPTLEKRQNALSEEQAAYMKKFQPTEEEKKAKRKPMKGQLQWGESPTGEATGRSLGTPDLGAAPRPGVVVDGKDVKGVLEFQKKGAQKNRKRSDQAEPSPQPLPTLVAPDLYGK